MESNCIESTLRVTELDGINNKLQELNNIAVDAGIKIRNFNDRVNGSNPEVKEENKVSAPTNSTVSAINETIDYLRSSLGEITSQASRLEDIG